MTVYLDTSIVLRRLRRKAPSLRRWGQWDQAFASVLLRVEILRTIDRLRLSGRVDDEQVGQLIDDTQIILSTVTLVPLTNQILERASQSFLTALGTLGALHLATALRLVEVNRLELLFLTHDAKLAVAARGVNFTVEGA